MLYVINENAIVDVAHAVQQSQWPITEADQSTESPPQMQDFGRDIHTSALYKIFIKLILVLSYYISVSSVISCWNAQYTWHGVHELKFSEVPSYNALV